MSFAPFTYRRIRANIPSHKKEDYRYRQSSRESSNFYSAFPVATMSIPVPKMSLIITSIQRTGTFASVFLISSMQSKRDSLGKGLLDRTGIRGISLPFKRTVEVKIRTGCKNSLAALAGMAFNREDFPPLAFYRYGAADGADRANDLFFLHCLHLLCHIDAYTVGRSRDFTGFECHMLHFSRIHLDGFLLIKHRVTALGSNGYIVFGCQHAEI